MANPNVLTATSIYGKCVVQTISTVASAQIVNVIQNLSGSGKLIKVTNINVTGYITSSGGLNGSFALKANGFSIYGNSSSGATPARFDFLSVADRDTSFYLNENQSLTMESSSTGSVNVTCFVSYEEIS
jgi:hypothetical protein